MRFGGKYDRELIGIFLQLDAVVPPSNRRSAPSPPAKRPFGTESERVEDDGAAEGGVWSECHGGCFIGILFESDDEVMHVIFTARCRSAAMDEAEFQQAVVR
jgi:hypothetical protein